MWWLPNATAAAAPCGDSTNSGGPPSPSRLAVLSVLLRRKFQRMADPVFTAPASALVLLPVLPSLEVRDGTRNAESKDADRGMPPPPPPCRCCCERARCSMPPEEEELEAKDELEASDDMGPPHLPGCIDMERGA